MGVAGAGKTTVCRPGIQALAQAGYEVLGVSLSQGATDVLGAETGIPTWNLADFLVRVEHTLLRTRDGEAVSLTPRTVILVDEAGTVDGYRQTLENAVGERGFEPRTPGPPDQYSNQLSYSPTGPGRV